MKENKLIDGNGQEITKILDNQSLKVDYRTLEPLLRARMRILNVGCGTGAISKDIANIVGESGKVIGIDNTEKFTESGKITYQHVKNLELLHTDIFDYGPNHKFDLIVSARVLQWLNSPKNVLLKMKSWLMFTPIRRVSSEKRIFVCEV